MATEPGDRCDLLRAGVGRLPRRDDARRARPARHAARSTGRRAGEWSDPLGAEVRIWTGPGSRSELAAADPGGGFDDPARQRGPGHLGARARVGARSARLVGRARADLAGAQPGDGDPRHAGRCARARSARGSPRAGGHRHGSRARARVRAGRALVDRRRRGPRGARGRARAGDDCDRRGRPDGAADLGARSTTQGAGPGELRAVTIADRLAVAAGDPGARHARHARAQHHQRGRGRVFVWRAGLGVCRLRWRTLAPSERSLGSPVPWLLVPWLRASVRLGPARSLRSVSVGSGWASPVCLRTGPSPG